MERQSLVEFKKNLSAPEKIVLEFQLKTLNFLKPYLLNQFRLETELGKIVNVKEDGNKTFDYDLATNNFLLETLREHDFRGELYSEETRWTKFGDAEEIIVSDPICNSSLLRRGSRNVASGVNYFRKNQFIAGALTDFGSLTICLADEKRVLRLLLDGESVLVQEARVSGETDVAKAFTAFSLYSDDRRREVLAQSQILEKLPLVMEVVGGQPFWAKLTQGYLDAYLNPFHGTKIYEAVSGEIARRAGAVIRDLEGRELNMGDYLEKLRTEENFRLKFIAAASEELYQKIQALI